MLPESRGSLSPPSPACLWPHLGGSEHQTYSPGPPQTICVGLGKSHPLFGHEAPHCKVRRVALDEPQESFHLTHTEPSE